MSIKVLRAPDMGTDLVEALDSGWSVPDMVHAVAQWALPKIVENYVAQEALIERKVGEAEEEAKRDQAAVRVRGQRLKTWVLLVGFVLVAAVIPLGLLVFWGDLEIGLFNPLGDAGLIWGVGGGIVLIGITALVLGIDRRSRENRDSMDRELEDKKRRLRDVEGELEPDAVLRVGRVYWAFELVKHPNGRCIPVNLAATRRADVVRLLCPGDSPADRAVGQDREAAATPSLSGVERALAALQGYRSDLARWQVDPSGLPLPVLPGNGERAFELEQELNAVLRYASVTSDLEPWPLIGRGGSIAALEEGTPLHTARWQRCLAQGGDWLEVLADLQAQTRRTAAHGMAAFQGMAGLRERPAAANEAPLADWVALRERQPETSGLLEELRSSCAEREERLRSGIESKRGEKLLDELRGVLQEIHHKPWVNIVDPMKEMKSAYSAAVFELNNVAAQLGALSTQDGDLDRRQQALSFTEQSVRDLVGRIGRLDADLNSVRRDAQVLQESARQVQAALDRRIPRRRRESPLDPSRVSRDLDRFQDQIKRAGRELEAAARAGQTMQSSAQLSTSLGLAHSQAQELLSSLRDYATHQEEMVQDVKQTRAVIEGEIKEWSRFRNRVDEYGREEKSALSTLNTLEMGLQGLETSMETLQQRLGRYQASALQITLSMKELVGRSEAAVRRVDAHLDDRERVLAKSRQDADRLQEEYYRGIEREKTRVKQEIEQLRSKQARVAWVARDPASIVDELAGCSVQRVARLYAAPHGLEVRDTIVGQVERAIASVRANIDEECERRMDAIRTAQQFADGALQIQPGNCGEADLLLVPIWYVEWRRTLDPEKPERKRYCYRLATPLEIAFKNGKRVQGELYPALTRYLQALPGLGEWEGEFAMGREPAGKLAAEARRHACLQDHEIEALVAGMREVVAQQAYPAGYDEMVEKSRDDLREWRDQAGRASRAGSGRVGARGQRRGVAL